MLKNDFVSALVGTALALTNGTFGWIACISALFIYLFSGPDMQWIGVILGAIGISSLIAAVLLWCVVTRKTQIKDGR